ncbi:MAG: YdeI/OmpD-associated family protein [Gemmatimonadota bacterium]
MAARDPRIDAYIEKSADFAKPILRHLRAVVHEACPEVEETIKWSFPHFDYMGMMCSMASFKAHCAFTFWKPELVLGDAVKEGAMGQFGPITSVKDLPPKKVLVGYVRKAVELNEAGVKPRRLARAAAKRKAGRRPARDVEAPDALAVALKKNRKAAATFEALSPSHRREYVAWITEAKRESTRDRRVAQAVAWLAEGKRRNWKHE